MNPYKHFIIPTRPPKTLCDIPVLYTNALLKAAGVKNRADFDAIPAIPLTKKRTTR